MGQERSISGSDAEDRSNSAQQGRNAIGADQNEQGRASFTTGSTTGGGSNYGQGSHQLGGGSYRQGSQLNEGSNYDNEAGRLADSSTGTSNEGSSSGKVGAAHAGNTSQENTSGLSARNSDTPMSAEEDRGQSNDAPQKPEEGDRRDTATGLEHDTHLDTDNTTANRRANSGSWSSGSTEEGQ